MKTADLTRAPKPPCKHLHGAQVDQFPAWVCGQCFEQLDGRPTKYGPSMFSDTHGGPQIITWQAEIKVAESGLNLADFMKAMALHFVKRCNLMHLTDAYAHALSVLKDQGQEFGDIALGWGREDAKELVNEELEYWEEEGDGSNG